MRNIWKFISYLGVKEDMPIYKQKSIILFNQIVRVIMLLVVLISIFAKYFLHIDLVAYSFLAILPFLGLILFLTYKGKILGATVLISVILPAFFVFISVFTKLNNQGMSVILYIVPRFGIIMATLIPIVILGFKDIKKAILGIFFGIFAFGFFDKIHVWAGIDIMQIPYVKEHLPLVIVSTSILFIFLAFLIIFLQNINSTYEKLVTKQKEEIEAQRDYVIQQRDQIEEQNIKIKDSIQYAKRIQTAALPSDESMISSLPEHFIFFKPRDIVSGDFYWKKEFDSKIIFAAADCTGHGVPGAFMSMLGISALNEIFGTFHNEFINNQINAAQVLNNLREKIKSSLHQTGKDDEAKDGMDISLCILDKENNNLHFAGANNPLYLVRNSELSVYKPDRMPIGIYRKEHEFTNHQIQLEKNDTLYIFSDGYVDQFGGAKNEKFKTSRFKKFVVSINSEDLEKQLKLFEENLIKWKGENEQLDDIIIIGVRI